MNSYNIASGILIGLIFKKITDKKKGKSNSLLGSIPDVIEIKHSIQGRIRFYIPSIVDNISAKENILAVLKNVSSIEEISIDIITGSIVIKYDPKEATPELIMGVIIKILELDKIIEEKRDPIVLKELKRIKEAFNYSFYKQTKGVLNFTTLVPLVLIYIGAKRIIVNKDTSVPNPYTLFYWAYKTLF